MKEIDLWKFIDHKINADSGIILMIVADSSKSSPGRPGFKMAVSSDGDLAGTIGGGIMEHNLVEECRSYLGNNKNISLVKKLYHNKNAEGEKSGLICGGTQTIIFKSLNTDNSRFIKGLLESYNNLSGGTLLIDDSGLTFDAGKMTEPDIWFNYDSEDNWNYKEFSGFPETVFVIGGGHVGLAVSKQMSLLDFYVVTIDSRKDVATMINNHYADKKLVLPYDEIGKYVIESNKTYAVIVTHGHDTDLTALRSIINKKLAYIGLMGSKRKIKSVFNKLAESGIDEALLEKVHAPVGLEIEAESPEEIAVSIAAEIIKVKNVSVPAGSDQESISDK